MLFNKISIFDGGMGSMIEALGLDVTNVEDLNITNSIDIQKIHLSYAISGADYITTNTFGLNRIKYHGKYDIKTLCEKAIQNAKKQNTKRQYIPRIKRTRRNKRLRKKPNRQ